MKPRKLNTSITEYNILKNKILHLKTSLRNEKDSVEITPELINKHYRSLTNRKVGKRGVVIFEKQRSRVLIDNPLFPKEEKKIFKKFILQREKGWIGSRKKKE